MEKLNQSYETIFVVDVQNGEEAVKALVEKFTKLIAANGEITSVNEWGKRRLAYPINDLNEGYYVLVNFTAPGAFAAELDRLYNINEGILRSIIVRCDEVTDSVKPDELTDDDDDDDEDVKVEVTAEEAPAEVAEAEETVEAADTADAAEEATETTESAE